MSKSLKLYIVLCSVFCTIIVTGNLIFQKFIALNIFGNVLEVSAGVLLYPITFLISDLVTEFYGKSYAKTMISVAVLCSTLVLIVIMIADFCTATSWSAVDDVVFHSVFNVYGVGAGASIIANYFGQRVDIHIYSYIKQKTSGRHLWLRNNMSTFVGQTVDTIIVVSLLSIFAIIPSTQFFIIILSSLSFKIIAALLDTPFCYLGYYLIKKFELARTT
jgi:queuosine precursor transporter